MDLTKVTVVGYDKEEGTSEDVNVQTLTQYGKMENQYEWHDFTKKIKGGGTQTYYGWYDAVEGRYIEEGDVVLKAGTGLWVSSTSDSFKILCNGQVFTPGCSVTLRENFLMVGNPRPVDVDLMSCWISGYDKEEGTSEDVNAQTLTQYGKMENQYEWHDFTKKIKGGGTQTYYGWYDAVNGEYVNPGEVTIKAGGALWVSSTSNAFVFNFPGILDDAPAAE